MSGGNEIMAFPRQLSIQSLRVFMLHDSMATLYLFLEVGIEVGRPKANSKCSDLVARSRSSGQGANGSKHGC